MKKPLVVLRTDASLQIGTGHVMRCLTLADALREKGASCRFICRPHLGHLIEQIRQRGHEVVALPAITGNATCLGQDGESSPAHAVWLGTDWETDAQETRAALAGAPVAWLIVDHYALDAQWEQRLRPACRNLMVIDDLADRPHDCDLLLDQNLGRDPKAYAELAPHCRILAGPRYALLRPEFATLRPHSLARRQDPQLRRLLITMGGVDKDNATGKVLDALRACRLPQNCEITVVMGPHAPWLEHVRQRAAQMPWLTEVKVNVHDMARLMAESDLAIGAAGGTAWERCCLGLPTLSMVLAPNQKEGAHALLDAGAILLVEDGPSLPAAFAHLISRVRHPDKLRALGVAAAGITDGKGTVEIAEVLIHA